MPTEVGIHDFADGSGKVVDGGPSPAITVWPGPMGDSFRVRQQNLWAVAGSGSLPSV
jgi:hypothetical protein